MRHILQQFLSLRHRQLTWAYYEPAGILISGTGQLRKIGFSKTLKNYKKIVFRQNHTKNFFEERHCLMCMKKKNNLF